MKRFLLILSLLCVFAFTCIYKGEDRVKAVPNTYYQVYLDGEELGIISSKEQLEKYINDKNKAYQEKFNTDTIYSPQGLDVEKMITYHGKVDSISSVYEKIVNKKPFTVLGYQFTLTKTVVEEGKNSAESVTKTLKVYTMSEEIFEKAVENIITTFVGEEDYAAYKNKTQNEIVTTGSYIDRIYLEDDITIKQTKIPVTSTIYTDASELSQFFLFGTTEAQKTYRVKAGDTIEDVAFNNRISVLEFLISNPSFTSEKSLLFPGQEVVIGVTNPQINVVVETSVVEDRKKHFSTITEYDNTLAKGHTRVKQKGVNGIERVSEKIKTINGNKAYIQPISNTEIKPPVTQIVSYGQKEVVSVGRTGNWLWPTRSGFTISSGYGWRANPFGGGRNLHTGIDIAGTGYGSPIYASNNGTVIVSDYHWSYGHYVVINHNNGYYTLYAHMSKRKVQVGDIVGRGETIGLVGQTGQATGPHLHFEVWRYGPPFSGTRLHPLSLKYYY